MVDQQAVSKSPVFLYLVYSGFYRFWATNFFIWWKKSRIRKILLLLHSLCCQQDHCRVSSRHTMVIGVHPALKQNINGSRRSEILRSWRSKIPRVNAQRPTSVCIKLCPSELAILPDQWVNRCTCRHYLLIAVLWTSGSKMVTDDWMGLVQHEHDPWL